MEITLENVELVKERTGVTYKEAKEALEANNGNVVDAIIAIESEIEAGNKNWVKEDATIIVEKIKDTVKKGNVSKIVISKDGNVILNIPVTVSLIGVVIAPWAAIAGTIAAFGTKCSVALVKDNGEVVDINGKALSGVEACKAKSAQVIEKVKDSELTEKVTEKAKELVNKVKESDIDEKAKEFAEKAKDFGGDVLEEIKNKINK